MKRAHTASSAVCVLAIAAFLLGGWEHPTAAQQASDELDLVQIRPNFYVIAGAGGNIVVQIGPDGVILVDSGTTEAADKVLATIRRLTPLPIRYIINTSMNADHVGGNDKLARAGLSILPGAVAAGAGLDDDLVSNSGRASVLAHENVLTRMTASTGPQAVPFALWPTKTFAYQAVLDVPERRRHSGPSHARGDTPMAIWSCSSAAAM